MLHYISLIICFFSIFLQVVSAQAMDQECFPVARVYQENICRAEIRNDPDRLEKLFQLIWDKALRHKFGEDFDEASEEEINAYLEAFRQRERQRYSERQQILLFIERLLHDNQYSEENKNKLENQKEMLSSLIKSYEEREKVREEYQEAYQRRQKSGARLIIGSWKRNKVLFDHYGGRIIFQQFGLEPIDAYEAFLKDVKEEGRVEILNEEFTEVFMRMEHYISMGHNFLPDNEETTSYFSSPFWLHLDTNNFEARKKELQTIPVLSTGSN